MVSSIIKVGLGGRISDCPPKNFEVAIILRKFGETLKFWGNFRGKSNFRVLGNSRKFFGPI